MSHLVQLNSLNFRFALFLDKFAIDSNLNIENQRFKPHELFIIKPIACAASLVVAVAE